MEWGRSASHDYNLVMRYLSYSREVVAYSSQTVHGYIMRGVHVARLNRQSIHYGDWCGVVNNDSISRSCHWKVSNCMGRDYNDIMIKYKKSKHRLYTAPVTTICLSSVSKPSNSAPSGMP